MEISEQEFRKLVEYIKYNYGVNLAYKKSLVVGRLQNHLVKNGFESFKDYINHLINEKSGDEAEILINKVTTNHTFFMRETEHFRYCKEIILPYLENKGALSKDLRVWSAGCSSGEEAYTLAMILGDFFSPEKGRWDTKVLATDISTRVLETALKGIYPNDRISSLPVHWQRNYFRKYDNENSVVSDSIKNQIIYRIFNLMNPFPFKKKFHVIFCRNVMIYFDNETKNDLANRFYEHTENGGYLFIGHSEALDRDETKYKYIMPGVYRKE